MRVLTPNCTSWHFGYNKQALWQKWQTGRVFSEFKSSSVILG
jgi:hypothetical protein